eukprot:TRINITY_DN104639_c0_g1_i1.p2 TRINITY_DN104639_c0_g1~~TRINITY_DN104639_c0_g1_i1.p2  ORF type:complete len:240 (+),score=128.38 TRINITY_DN104639_c0_g1_i1:24-722(+)
MNEEKREDQENLAEVPLPSLVELEEPEPVDEEDDKPHAKKAQLRDILDTMFPPQRFEDEDGQAYVQRVSARKAEREDVVTLQMKLDQLLQERQAREAGICPVRAQLYAQAFDELIRQVTTERPERGLLLLRTRDEIKMTINAYKTLFDSSTTFGMRKTMQAEQGHTTLQTKIDELEAKKAKLQAQLRDERNKLEGLEKQTSEKRAIAQKKRAEERDFLKHQAQHLDSYLQSV